MIRDGGSNIFYDHFFFNLGKKLPNMKPCVRLNCKKLLVLFLINNEIKERGKLKRENHINIRNEIDNKRHDTHHYSANQL